MSIDCYDDHRVMVVKLTIGAPSARSKWPRRECPLRQSIQVRESFDAASRLCFLVQ
jgi:hypothetical protein